MRDYSNFEGPSEEQEREAYRRCSQRRVEQTGAHSGCGMQTSGQHFVGTPRRAKHDARIGGVRVR